MATTRVRSDDEHVAGPRPGVGRPRSSVVLRLLLGERTASLPRDVATAVARVALAWIFVYYGGGKLFGAFNGPGLHATALYFDNVAHLHPGGFFAVLGGLIEFGGGVALAIGFATRLAAIALFGDMVVAMITVTWATGIDSVRQPPGYQLNLALCVLALVVVILGAGRLSVDAFLARRLGLGIGNSRPTG